jgi:hypothetical protein
VCYGGIWALFLTVFAVDFAAGWIFNYGFFGVFLECEDASFAEFDAFAACGAFFIVYGWVPLDLVSGCSFIGFLGHIYRHSVLYTNIVIDKHLNIVMN